MYQLPHIPRRTYRPDLMDTQQRETMRLAAQAVIEFFAQFNGVIIAARRAQRINCGNLSTLTVVYQAAIIREVQQLAADLSPDVQFPEFDLSVPYSPEEKADLYGPECQTQTDPVRASEAIGGVQPAV